MRISYEAKAKGKVSTSAAAYDELVYRRMAQLSEKRVSDFDPVKALQCLERKIMEQAFQLAETCMKNNDSDQKPHRKGSAQITGGWAPQKQAPVGPNGPGPNGPPWAPMNPALMALP